MDGHEVESLRRWVERSETHHNVIHHFEINFCHHGFDTVAMSFAVALPILPGFAAMRLQFLMFTPVGPASHDPRI
jgi:hypothetical protein